MKRNRNFYILVHDGNKLIFVTELDNSIKNVYWNYKQPPLKLAQSYAEDIVEGLSINGYRAFVFESLYPIENQIFYKEN